MKWLSQDLLVSNFLTRKSELLDVKKYFTIYKTTNLISGKIYVGKHVTYDYDDDYLGSGKALNISIRKYGQENFKKEILYVFENEEEMNTKEIEIVTEEFCKRRDTYNICVGGTGGNLSEYSLIHNPLRAKCPKHRKAISEGVKKSYENGRDRNTPNWSFEGREHTEETKKKIGEANSKRQKGSGNSQFGTMWITDGIENKKIRKTDPVPDGWRKGRQL